MTAISIVIVSIAIVPDVLCETLQGVIKMMPGQPPPRQW
jgi:hypothetical protein